MEPSLCLVVLRVTDLARSRKFYESLGLTFREEQHGSGPVHLACELAGAVFEIYPAASVEEVTWRTRIGFCVPEIDESIAVATSRGGQIVNPAGSGPWGRRAVVRDPDGHDVELIEPFHV